MRGAGLAGCALLALIAAWPVGLVHAATAPAAPAAAPREASKGKGKSKKAKGAAEAKRPAVAAEKLDALRGLLTGDDDAAALDAAAALGSSGASNAADPLVEILAAGTSSSRAQAALDAMAKLGEAGVAGSDRAIEVLELYAGNHTTELRSRAVKALGAVRDPRVVATLIARLGDAAPEVRAVAAEALAARKEQKASPRLFALVKRGDAGAAGPLATLATPDLVPQIAELAGSVDDNVLGTALGEYVKRDDVPDKLRIDVLRTISRLGGAAGTTALIEYLASVPAKDDRPSKREAQKLLDGKGSPQ